MTQDMTWDLVIVLPGYSYQVVPSYEFALVWVARTPAELGIWFQYSEDSCHVVTAEWCGW